MQPDVKLNQVFAQAANILDARPAPVLAKIARTAKVFHKIGSPDKVAVALSNEDTVLPSWPIDYFSDETLSLSVDELAATLIRILDDFDARGRIKRPNPVTDETQPE